MFRFLRNCKTVFQWLYHFTFPFAKCKLFNFFTYWSAVNAITIFYVSSFHRCVVVSCVVLIYISLIPKDVEHPFMYHKYILWVLGPIYQFFLLRSVFLMSRLRTLLSPRSQRFFSCICFSNSFRVLCFTFKVAIRFKFIFV